MAKFKRYDPRNKKASYQTKDFQKQNGTRKRVIIDDAQQRRKFNEKELYSFTEEFDL